MSVYGNKLNASENDIVQPISWYGKHKLLSENLIRDFSIIKPKIKCNCLRLFNVYGPRSRTSGTYGAMFGVF